jgi:Lipocalin-like domain
MEVRMVRLIGALVLVLLLVTPSLGQQSLVGTYKLASLAIAVDGTPTQIMGKAPHGYLVITPTHFVIFFTADNRTFGTSVAEKAALFDTLIGYAGTYRVEGDKFINTDEVSWVENMNGKTVVQKWQLSGNRLSLTEGPMPWPPNPSKTLIRTQVWEKVE